MRPHKSTRKPWFIAALAGVVLGCGLVAYLGFNQQPISIAANIWLGYEPMFQSRSEGWLDTQQVHLLETQSVTESVQAVVDGRVDGAALTLDEVLWARASGTPLTVVMVFDISAGADVLLARSDIKTLTDLKAKRIGFEANSLGQVMLTEVLRAAHLKKQDVELVLLPHEKQLAAWQQDELDAVITYEPVAGQLLAHGAAKLFDSSQIPNTVVDVLAIRTDRLDYQHASALRALIDAHFKALDYFYHNPQDAAYRMASHLGLPALNVLHAYKGLVLPNLVSNYRLLTGSAPTLQTTAKKVSNVMVEAKLLKQDDDLTDLINTSFLPADVL